MVTLRFAKVGVPEWYKCDGCDAHGVKLWRNDTSFEGSYDLLCCDCVGVDQQVDVSLMNDVGLINDADCIGEYIPAVPVDDDKNFFWTYYEWSDEDIRWWKGLPNR